MAGIEDKQSVSTTSSVSAARLAQSTTPPLGEGRSVAFPPPEPEIVQITTTPVPKSELTVEVGVRPTTGHLEDYFTVQPITPSLSASGGDHQTTLPPTDPIYFYTRSP